MNKIFEEFLKTRLVRVVGGSCELRRVYLQFLDQLPPRERKVWPRWRFRDEIRSYGATVAKGCNKIEEIVGMSLLPPTMSIMADAPPRMSAAVDEPALVTAIKTETRP